MNKQAVRVLYVDLLYSYELIVLYGPPKPSFGRSPFFFFRPDDWTYLPTSGPAF